MALNEFQFAEAYTELSLRGQNKFHNDVRGVTRSLESLKRGFESVARHARRMLLVGGGALAAFVKMASDAAEAQSKFDAVFKENADSVRAWTKELGAAVGRSKAAIQNTMSAFQAFFVGMGFGTQQAIELSKKMQALAIDFASFHNLSDTEASRRFVSALSGSSEVLDMFGINIKQAALEQELMTMGVADSILKATEQEKALARVNVIFRAMGQQGAIGAAADETSRMASQFRQLKDRLTEVAVELGQIFIPMVQRAVKALNKMLVGMQDMSSATKDSIQNWVLFAGAFAGFLVIVPTILGALVKLKVAMMLMGAGTIAATAIGGLIVALGLLGAAFVAAKIKGESFGEFIGKLSNDILGITDAVGDKFMPSAGEAARFKREEAESDKRRAEEEAAKKGRVPTERAQAIREAIEADPEITGFKEDRRTAIRALRGAQERLKKAKAAVEFEKANPVFADGVPMTPLKPLQTKQRLAQGEVIRMARRLDELESSGRSRVSDVSDAAASKFAAGQVAAKQAKFDANVLEGLEVFVQDMNRMASEAKFGRDMVAGKFAISPEQLDLQREISEAGQGRTMQNELDAQKGRLPRLRAPETNVMGMAQVQGFMQAQITKGESEIVKANAKTQKAVEEGNQANVEALKDLNLGFQ